MLYVSIAERFSFLAILLPFLFDDWFIADIRLFISHNFFFKSFLSSFSFLRDLSNLELKKIASESFRDVRVSFDLYVSFIET